MAVEKALPHSIEAEIAVLGSLLIDPESLEQIDFLQPEDFYRDAHKTVFRVARMLQAKRLPVDLVTLCDELRDTNVLDEVGGTAFITSLINEVPTSAHIEHYAHKITGYANRRRLVHAAGQIAALAFAESDDKVAGDQAEQLIFKATQRKQRTDFVPVVTLMNAYMGSLDVSRTQGTYSPFISLKTGYKRLDHLTGGFHKGNLSILAARPSMGKTSLAVSLAYQMAQLAPQAVIGILTLEMTRDELMQRFLALESGVSTQAMRSRNFTDEEIGRLMEAMGNLSVLNLYIDDTTSPSMLDIRAKARRLKAQHGLDFLIIDYLQLISASSSSSRGMREQEISMISAALKGLGRELDLPILALSQLNRDVEKRLSKVPQLSDLRESGSIEQDGDLVLFLYRDVVYNPDTADPKAADLYIAKQRNGPTGQVRLSFQANQTRFYDFDIDE